MAAEATAGSGFGFVELPEEEPLDIVEGLPAEEVETEETASTETTQEPITEPAAKEPPGEAEAEPEGTPEGGEEPVYFGKFRGVDALQEGYRHAETRLTQATQEAAQMRRDFEAMQGQVQQQNTLLESLAPMILQQQMEVNPELAEQLQAAMREQAMVEQAQAPLKAEMERLQQDREQQNARLAVAATVNQWRQTHPDITPNSEADRKLAQAFEALELDLEDTASLPESLNLALEASQNPALLEVLRVNPHWIEMDGGVDFAKRWLAQQAQPAAQSAQRAAQQRGAFVETGGQGAPISGAPGGQKDEFDEAIAVYNAERNSPLFQ